MPTPMGHAVLTKQEELTRLLGGRTAVYYGEQSSLAKEIGCTREWVRQLLDRMEIQTISRPVNRCTNCNQIVQPKTLFCRKCRSISNHVGLTCSRCKKHFYRVRSKVERYYRYNPSTQRRNGFRCNTPECRALY